jgi:hypothetical protein
LEHPCDPVGALKRPWLRHGQLHRGQDGLPDPVVRGVTGIVEASRTEKGEVTVTTVTTPKMPQALGIRRPAAAGERQRDPDLPDAADELSQVTGNLDLRKPVHAKGVRTHDASSASAIAHLGV